VLANGYLFLIGMAVIEWRLTRLMPAEHGRWQRRRHGRLYGFWQGLSPLGIAQVALPTLSAVALTFSILLGMTALDPLSLALLLGGIAIFLVRLREPLAHARWLERGSERHYALAAFFLVAYAGLFTYVLLALTLGAYHSLDAVPAETLAALDHTLFLGVMSNALFGVIQEMTTARRRFWPATEDVLFWGMNVGVAGFVLALLVHGVMVTPLLEGIFTPLLGASLLVAIVAYSVRLWRVPVWVEGGARQRRVPAAR
jgi:hypothetical protein